MNDISSITIPLPLLPSVHHGIFHSLVSSLIWDSQLPSPSMPSPSQAPTYSESAPSLDLLRVKGYLKTTTEHHFVLQGVRDVFDIIQVPNPKRGDQEIESKLVLIGRGLGDGTEIRDCFLSALEEGLRREREEQGE